MKLKKLLLPLYLVAASLCVVGCQENKSEYSTDPRDLVWYFPFHEYSDIPEPNYFSRSAYHKITMTGHELTSFDEEERIAAYIHLDFKGCTRIDSFKFKKSDNYVKIVCSDFERPFTQRGICTFYDNGYILCKFTPSYSDDKEFFYKTSEEEMKKFFDVVEDDFRKIESGERNYYNDAKSYCSLDKFYEMADEELQKERSRMTYQASHPFTAALGYYSSGYSSSLKEHVSELYDIVKDIPHTFKGYKTVDYHAAECSIFALRYEDYYSTYAYVMDGGSNFSSVGVTMCYGDYNDGDYHFLIAEYTIDSEKGEALFEKAFAPLKETYRHY